MLEIKKKRRGKKLTDWANEPSAGDLNEDLELSASSMAEQIDKIYAWRALYDIENDPNMPREGKSGIELKLIKRFALWRMAVLQHPLTRDTDLFKIKPNSPSTILAAIQNQTLLNYQFNTRINKRKFIDDLLSALVIDGTAIIRVSWDYEEITRRVERPIYKHRKPSKFEMWQIYRASSIYGLTGLYQDALLHNRGLKAMGEEIPENFAAVLDGETIGDDPTKDFTSILQSASGGQNDIASMQDELTKAGALANQEDAPADMPVNPEQMGGNGVSDLMSSLGMGSNPNEAPQQTPLDAINASGSPMGGGMPAEDPMAMLGGGEMPAEGGADPMALLGGGESPDYASELGSLGEGLGEEMPEQDIPPEPVESPTPDAESTPKKLMSPEEELRLAILPENVLEASVKESERLGHYVVATPTKRTEMVNEPYVIRNQPALSVVDPEEVYFDPTCRGDLTRARFVIYSFVTSLSELKSQGNLYTNLNVLERVLKNEDSQENEDSLVGSEYEGNNFEDFARKKIIAYEYWGYWDINNDGSTVPIVATFIGDVMIRLEENPYPDKKIPFVAIPYHPIKDSIFGEPDAELLKDHQQMLTAISRMINNVSAKSAAGQVAMPKGFLDPHNKDLMQKGKNYEYNFLGSHPAEAFYVHKGAELPEALVMQYQRLYTEAESIVGINTHSQGMDQPAYMQANSSGGQDVMFLTQIESNILGRISYGLQEVARKMVLMNCLFVNDVQMIPISGTKFTKVTPEDLQGLPDDMNISVELTSLHETMERINKLSFLLQTIAPSFDFSVTQPIIATIAQMSDLPMIADAIMNYQPQQDPNADQANQADAQLKQAQAYKAQQEGEAEKSQAHYYDARAEYIYAMKQQLELQMSMASDGTEHARAKDLMASQAEAQGLSALAKDRNNPYSDLASERILAKEKTRNKPQSYRERVGFDDEDGDTGNILKPEQPNNSLDLTDPANSGHEARIPDKSNIQISPDAVLNNLNPLSNKNT